MPGPQISLLTKAQGEPNGHVRSTHLNNRTAAVTCLQRLRVVTDQFFSSQGADITITLRL